VKKIEAWSGIKVLAPLLAARLRAAGGGQFTAAPWRRRWPFWRDEVIDAHSILGDRELNSFNDPVEFVSTGPVVRRDRRCGVHPTSQPSSAEKSMGSVAPTLPSPTFLPST